MKLVVMMFVLCSILLVQAQEYLVSVPNLPKKHRTTGMVVENLGSHALMVVDEAGLTRLEKDNVDVTRLDSDPRLNEYYLVTLIRDTEENLADVSTILYKYPYVYLVRVVPSMRDLFFNLKTRRCLVSMEAIVFTDDNPPRGSLTGSEVYQENATIKKIVEEVSKENLRSYVTKLCSFQSRDAPKTKESVAWIMEQLKAFGADSVYMQPVSNGSFHNPVAILKGKGDKPMKEYCLIGGHNDAMPACVNAGADDNASGTAAMMEALRIFAKYEFEENVRFVGFNGEEKGMLGSKAFANEAKSQGHTIIGGCINLDMIGYNPKKGSTGTVYLHCNQSFPTSKAFGDQFAKMSGIYNTKVNVSVLTDGTFKNSSDQISFWNAGFNSFLAIEAKDHSGLCSGYHSAQDKLDVESGLNDSDYMTAVAKTAIAQLAELAKPTATSLEFNVAASRRSLVSLVHVAGAAKDRITITSNQVTPATIYLYSTSGKQVASHSVGDLSKATLTTPKLGNGFYQIHILTGTNAIVKQFVVVR